MIRSLARQSSEEVRSVVLHSGVGGITEGDVLLAEASDATILGFGVVPDARARVLAEQKGVDVRTYRVIYQLLEDVTKALSGLLAAEVVEEVTGRAEVRETFKISRIGTIAGCNVLDGVTDRMAEVENGPQVLLAFVANHDLRLDLAVAGDQFGQDVLLAGSDRLGIRFLPRQERRVADRGVLDAFAQPGRVVTPRQRRQQVGIDHHRARLVEGADEVLAGRVVQPGLPAHRRVDGGFQRGGDLDEADAAQPSRRDEPPEIPDHAAPERDDQVSPFDPGFGQPVVQPPGKLARFTRLAGRNGEDGRRRVEPGNHFFQVELGDVPVGDDRDLMDLGQPGHHARQPLARPCSDVNRVFPSREIDAHGPHRPCSQRRFGARRACILPGPERLRRPEPHLNELGGNQRTRAYPRNQRIYKGL